MGQFNFINSDSKLIFGRFQSSTCVQEQNEKFEIFFYMFLKPFVLDSSILLNFI